MKSFVFFAVFAALIFFASATNIDSYPVEENEADGEPDYASDFSYENDVEEFEEESRDSMDPAPAEEESRSSKDPAPGWSKVGRVIRRVVRKPVRVVRRVVRKPVRIVRRLIRGLLPRQCRQSKHYRRGPNVHGYKASAYCIRQMDYRKQALCWAPRIYLAVGERFNPSSVEFFLRYTSVYSNRGHLLQRIPHANNLRPVSNAFLGTRQRLASATSVLPFFHGEHPSRVPIYAFFKEFKRGCDIYREFIYYAFFPYNQGKSTCMGPVIKDRCIGSCRWFGHHVGDWEHVKVQLKNNYPHKMYISAHDFGGTYMFDRRHMTFRKGGDLIKFTRNGHPIVFCAKGSHGMWTKQGIHTYKKLFYGVKLQDLASAGTPWDTWRTLKFIKVKKGRKPYKGSNYWMNFNGRWGNKERKCFRIRLFNKQFVKQCTLESGPGSLKDRSSLTSTNW